MNEKRNSNVTINISGGSHRHFYGPVPPQQEPDDSPIEQLEEQPAKSHEIVSSCQKRLSELRQRVCTYDGTQTPDAEFWQGLYRLCEGLERDLDRVLE